MPINIRLYIFLLFAIVNSQLYALQKVSLEKYGDIKTEDVTSILQKAFNDIENKCLILPRGILNVNNLTIESKNNFKIQGFSTILQCKKIEIKNCSQFEIENIEIYGVKNKFAYFNIIGNCHDFSIHDCYFNSEKDEKGNNTFYGIHIICDNNNSQKSYTNSPRFFDIYKNKIKNTRYNGILIHALCSNFNVYNNTVDSAQCIGIEVEGRLGNNKNTSVYPCKNGNIYNNNITNCGDWGILLIWSHNINVYKNICKNNIGCFLSIGCTNTSIYQNFLVGIKKGFEISQEYYSIDKGINDNIRIYNNKIIGKPRAENRGVIDIRHAQNIFFEKNKITCIYRKNGSCFSIASARNIHIISNHIKKNENIELNKIIYNEAPDPENNHLYPIKSENCFIEKNTFNN